MRFEKINKFSKKIRLIAEDTESKIILIMSLKFLFFCFDV